MRHVRPIRRDPIKCCRRAIYRNANEVRTQPIQPIRLATLCATHLLRISRAHARSLSRTLSLAFITNRPSQFLIFRESRNYAMLCLRYVFGEARVRVFRSYYYIRKRAGRGADGSVEIVIIIAQAPHHQTHHRHHYQHHRQPHRVFSSPTGCFAPRRSLTLSCARALSHTSTLSLSLSPS